MKQNISPKGKEKLVVFKLRTINGRKRGVLTKGEEKLRWNLQCQRRNGDSCDNGKGAACDGFEIPNAATFKWILWYRYFQVKRKITGERLNGSPDCRFESPLKTRAMVAREADGHHHPLPCINDFHWGFVIYK